MKKESLTESERELRKAQREVDRLTKVGWYGSEMGEALWDLDFWKSAVEKEKSSDNQN